MTPTRGLTVTPVEAEVGAVVVLPEPTCNCDRSWLGGHPRTSTHLTTCPWTPFRTIAAGDVLRLVERCERCDGEGAHSHDEVGRGEWCERCNRTGHLLVGTVTVDEVLPVLDELDVVNGASMPVRCVLVRVWSGECWLIGGPGESNQRLTLPSPPSPGSVLLRVTVDRTVECETCSGDTDDELHRCAKTQRPVRPCKADRWNGHPRFDGAHKWHFFTYGPNDEYTGSCAGSGDGSHCNCSMVQDVCHWCGLEWLGDGEVRCPVTDCTNGRIPFPVRPVTVDGPGPIATIREVE